MAIHIETCYSKSVFLGESSCYVHEETCDIRSCGGREGERFVLSCSHSWFM